MKSEDILVLGVMIVLLGMLVIFTGILAGTVFNRSGDSNAEVRGGGVIMIGPIPVIFGTDRESAKTVILLAIFLVILTYVLFRRG